MDIRYNIREENLLIAFEDGTRKIIGELSDGQKVVLGLVADLATRLAWLNPGLEGAVLTDTPGIVLIDELDLHLHPRWQRRIVGDLKRTFPKFQFIASSHSPFIIQSLQPGELVNLDHGSEPRSRYWEQGLEEIAEEEMDVEMPQRSERYGKMLQAAERYFRLARMPGADPDQLVDAEQDLEAASAEFSDDPAYAAQISAQISARIKLEKLAQKGTSTRVADETS
jgi:predicted ATP-binding protein involved in virulence